jgi:hypothetical protein
MSDFSAPHVLDGGGRRRAIETTRTVPQSGIEPDRGFLDAESTDREALRWKSTSG